MDELTNMKEKKKRRMSKKDWVLIVVILCVAGLAFLLHEVIGADGAGSVTVKVNGKIEGVYSLAEDREIKINGGSNVLVIKNHEADMVDANCPDKLCFLFPSPSSSSISFTTAGIRSSPACLLNASKRSSSEFSSISTPRL